MAVCCVYFDEEGTPPCQVVRLTDGPRLEAGLQHRVQQRYCTRGTFITCPLYQRVERWLQQAYLLRWADQQQARAARPAEELVTRRAFGLPAPQPGDQPGRGVADG